jgi:hypothetical protein
MSLMAMLIGELKRQAGAVLTHFGYEPSWQQNFLTSKR